MERCGDIYGDHLSHSALTSLGLKGYSIKMMRPKSPNDAGNAIRTLPMEKGGWLFFGIDKGLLSIPHSELAWCISCQIPQIKAPYLIASRGDSTSCLALADGGLAGSDGAAHGASLGRSRFSLLTRL